MKCNLSGAPQLSAGRRSLATLAGASRLSRYNRRMSRKSKATRREFIKGQAAIDAISDLPNELDPADHQTAPAAAGDASYLVQVARDAMACEFQVLLNAGQYPGAVEAALKALDRVEAVEDQLTAYRPYSEISKLNLSAFEADFAAESGLFNLLKLAQCLSEETGGAFDVTAGALAKTWGFHRREGRLPSKDAIQETLQSIGSNWLELDAANQTVRFRRAGLEINLGGIGKGYALDRAAEHLDVAGVDDYLIHGGQSSVLARGSRWAGQAAQRGWRVAIRNPLRQQQRLAEVWLHDRALGTSGSGNQFFHFAGKRYGHVIDPRTGYPADEILSATVLAPTATLADALATAFFVMGVKQTIEFCQARSELAVLLACPGTRDGSLVVHTEGLEPSDCIFAEKHC
jgi:thiamine biosynthesis lipoprotein